MICLQLLDLILNGCRLYLLIKDFCVHGNRSLQSSCMLCVAALIETLNQNLLLLLLQVIQFLLSICVAALSLSLGNAVLVGAGAWTNEKRNHWSPSNTNASWTQQGENLFHVLSEVFFPLCCATACALGTFLSYHMCTTFSSHTENWGSKKFMLSFKDLGERNLQLGQITKKESGDFLWTFLHRLSFCAKR